jgi:immunoglobulin-binding protein 1
MAQSDPSLRTLFAQARDLRKSLDALQTNTDLYQESLRSAISSFTQCQDLVDRAGIFSINEEVNDIASADLPLLSVQYHLGDIFSSRADGDRKVLSRQAQTAYDRFLNGLDSYDMLSPDDKKLYDTFTSDKDNFTLLSQADASKRRETKIARFKQEAELKRKLEVSAQVRRPCRPVLMCFQFLSRNPDGLQNDDPAARDLHLAELSLQTHQTFHALDQIAQELKVLALAPPSAPPNHAQLGQDPRLGDRKQDDGYSPRLDPPISQLLHKGKAGPILSREGKPLRPFTLLDNRQRLRDGVFRPDHSLPTMTIDEYLEEERRRGGIIEGGGQPPERVVDEDDMKAADEETMKARQWDEFKEANPRGSGNTLNRG